MRRGAGRKQALGQGRLAIKQPHGVGHQVPAPATYAKPELGMALVGVPGGRAVPAEIMGDPGQQRGMQDGPGMQRASGGVVGCRGLVGPQALNCHRNDRPSHVVAALAGSSPVQALVLQGGGGLPPP